MLPYAPVILAVAIAVILSLAIATKRVNDVPLVSKNRADERRKDPLGRQILEKDFGKRK